MCDNGLAWAPGCTSSYGGTQLDAVTIYNYIQNAGWSGIDAWYALAICYHESSFWSGAEAYCPPGSCFADVAVDAVGLFQLYLAQHTDISRADALDPEKNVNYAYQLYRGDGFNPWLGTWPDIAKSLVSTVQAMVAQGTITPSPPGGSESGAPPPDSGPPTQPGTQPPPSSEPAQPLPPIPPYVTTPTYQYPEWRTDGWDNLMALYKHDMVWLYQFDAALVREITDITGG